ncbi:hypothetical protein ABPG74_004555 [Tetrahymena malaccensis]
MQIQYQINFLLALMISYLFIQIFKEMNDKGSGVLNLGEYDKQLQFGQNPIVQGLLGIYEGNTICYPKVKVKGNFKQKDNYLDFRDLQIVGTSSEMRPCIFVLNATKYRGRVVFDCGFTKVYPCFWNQTRGTSRYVTNCYCWLNYIESNQKDAQLEPS